MLAETLHGARQYGEIVTVLRDAGREAEAERWARRGLAEDPASYWADELREQLGVAIYSVKRSLSVSPPGLFMARAAGKGISAAALLTTAARLPRPRAAVPCGVLNGWAARAAQAAFP